MQELILVQPGRSFERSAAERKPGGGAHEHTQNPSTRFEALLVDCGPLVFRVAHGVLRNSADAEDVVQEAMLRAYLRFDRLRDPSRFRPWLVRIAFRLALDRARSHKRREQRETLWFQSVPHATTGDAAVPSELASRLEAALDELSPKYRLVLLLCAIEGHTLEEVAGMLGVPVGTVKSRLFSGRKQLAEKLRCYVNTTDPR